MKKKSKNTDRNSNKNQDSIKSLTRFYNDNKSVINGIGIATLAGVAVYSLVKWVPFSEIVNKIEEKFDNQFADKEFSNIAEQEA
jgi:hypothetical protein